MRRPLAVFSLCLFAVMLAAVRLPAGVLYASAGFFVLLFGAALLLRRRLGGGALPALLAGAAAAALALCAGHTLAVVRPVAALAGEAHTATARVLATQPGYSEGSMNAELRVLSLEGGSPTGFKLWVTNLPAALPGDELTLTLRFSPFGGTDTRAYHCGKGRYVAAAAADAAITGASPTPATRLRLLQYAAGENILAALPRRLSAVAAAMAVGDRRFLPADTTGAYRMAGLSHLLVVSGLHLAILCAGLNSLLRGVFGLRRGAALGCIAFVVGFALFTGLTPSVVRSGLMCLLVYAAPLLHRRADVLTSLGLAAVLLLAANPFACADVGLMLSFAATLGALASGEAARRLRGRWAKGPLLGKKPRHPLLLWPRRAAKRLAIALLTPVCVTLATLPVLVYAGMGVSLMAVPANLVAVPLLPFIVVSGLFMALPAGSALGWLAAPFSIVGGGLLVLLEKLTAFCAGLRGVWVPLGGAFGLAVVVALYAMAALAAKTRRPAAVLSASLILPVALALHLALSRGTVKAVVAGGQGSPSLVVIQNRQAVVLYRGRQTSRAVQDVLVQNNVRQCVLLIDMRLSPGGTEHEAWAVPVDEVRVASDRPGRGSHDFTDDVTIYTVRQGNANLACADIAGYKIGLAAGGADFTPYAALDLLVAGTSPTEGSYTALLAAGRPEWADPDARFLALDGEATVWLRPGKSVIIREVHHGEWS